MTDKRQIREPLIQISKRANESWKHVIVVKLVAVFAGLLAGSLFCWIASDTGENPIYFFIYLFKGVFGNEYSLAEFVRKAVFLLMASFALLPAFKMKFWNLGGNGQIAIGALVAVMFMKFMGGTSPDWLVILLMIVGGALAGAVWAVIPAIFKALFKTNESLFTLMMNYIAAGLVSYFLVMNSDLGSGTLKPISFANINIAGLKYSENWICGIIAAIIVALIVVYFKFTKRGFEVSIVGESENTARYVGVNVKKVVIRTMVLSGAVFGLMGALLVGSVHHTIFGDIAENMGFTGIMVAWMGKLNPVMMIVVALFISFVNKGMSAVRTNFGFTNTAVSNIVLGIIYFCIIASEFLIEYAIKLHKKNGSKACKAAKAEEVEKQ